MSFSHAAEEVGGGVRGGGFGFFGGEVVLDFGEHGGAHGSLAVVGEHVLVKRPYLTKEMCLRVVTHPLKKEMQEDGERVRFWAEVAELDGRFLRVITLADEQTIHNAFPDRRFKP